MHRIDSDAATSDNKFTDGNPAVGQLGTIVDAPWLNDVQENIAQAIEHAAITLVKGDGTQLWKAIAAIAAGVLGIGGDDGVGVVPTTREVDSGGLVQGGGPLSGNLTLTVNKASGAEVLTGTEDGKAVTPKAIADAIQFVKGVPGRISLFGFMLQWGTATAAANTFTSVGFPVAFTSTCAWGDCAGGSADSSAQDNDPFVAGVTAAALSIFNARDGAVPVRWFAFGW